MDMQLLVQKKDKIDAEKAIKFIEKCKNAKLAIVHSSVKDDVISLDFFQSLVEKLKTPFAGMRVSGTATPEGYVEDAVAIAVLCGDFDVKVFHEKINFEDLEGNADKIIPKLEGRELCLVYSANYIKKDVFVDAILRRVQAKYPNLQIFGGVSAPPPLIATNEGIYDDSIAFASFRGLEYDFTLDSGFQFDKTRRDEFVITKSDEYYVYEINGKNAVEEYSKIQHLRPYFLNMMINLLTKANVAKIAKSLFKASSILREGGVRVGVNVLGSEMDEKTVEMLAVLELNEDNKYLLATSYKPSGTIFKWTTNSKDLQLKVYDRFYNRLHGGNSILINACCFTQYWIDFDFKALEEKLGKFKCPFLLSFVFGEFGATLPYKGPEQNVVHGGTVKALAFK